MSTKYFNFNNEADVTPVEVNDETGVVTFTMGDETAEFNTLQEFAEFYAVARNVIPENLKNWEMTEDGNHFAFVLKVGTAGLEADEVAELVAGLRSAGMSPEEIGRAVAAAQSEARVEEAEAVAVATIANRTDELVEYLSGLDTLSQRVLAKHFVDDSSREIPVAALAAEIATHGAFETYLDDGDFDEYAEEITGLAAVKLHVSDILSDELDALTEQYPDVPVEVAFDLVNGTILGDDSIERQVFQNAKFAASMAGRGGFEVKVVSPEGVATIVQTDSEGFAPVFEASKVYKDGHRFVLVQQ